MNRKGFREVMIRSLSNVKACIKLGFFVSHKKYFMT